MTEIELHRAEFDKRLREELESEEWERIRRERRLRRLFDDLPGVPSAGETPQ